MRPKTIISPLQGFLLGLKSAIFEPKSDAEKVLYSYPHQDLNKWLPEPHTIVFQKEELKQKFLSELKTIDHPRDFHRLLGSTLGYPPKAVEDFVKRHELLTSGVPLESFVKNTIGLRYCGVECSGHVNDLIDDCKWLWDHYPQGYDVLKVEKNRVLYPISFHDFVKLERVKKTLAK